MDEIRIIFVLSDSCKDESDMSDIMIQAYESCKENVKNVEWIEEKQLKHIDLSKTDFVIFQEFIGENFENIKQSKCAILGPWCVSICLIEGRPIPNFPWPIYNIAMVDCIVSCSHLPKTRKNEIKEKVQLMGGCYTDCLTSTNTHLITDTVKSEKYMQAAEAGSKLMLSEWIDDVWRLSQSNNIHANDEQFNKYRVLPFHNLTICSTGLSKDQRKDITNMVTKNGGIFTGSLCLANTDILVVCGSTGVNSDKYKAARNTTNIQCVTMDWIVDSITKGYALPYNNYSVKKTTSTPTRFQIDPNFSTISAIAGPVAFKTTLEETATSSPVPSTSFSKISPNKRPSSELCKLIDGLDVKKAKNAGQFLDGCSVYLAGFDGDHKEKLCKILNLSGATRYDDLSERITHIIIGDQSSNEVKLIKSKNTLASLVSLHWLIDCIENQRLIDEEDYLVNLHNSNKENFSSPLGKKGLSFLRSKKILTEVDVHAANVSTEGEPESEPENLILQHYFNSQLDTRNQETDTLVNMLKDADTNFNHLNKNDDVTTGKGSFSQISTTDLTHQIDIFDNLRFVLLNFDVTYTEFLQEQIENASGIIMSKTYTGIPDYIVTEKFLKTGIQNTANHIINDIWILESIQNEKLCDLQYYHYPFILKNTMKPLANCVVVISGYAGFERQFLRDFINELGGIAQEQLARVSRPDMNLLASTHLIIAEASGRKYDAALKWGLPIVSKEWLIECSRTGCKVDEDRFLMCKTNINKTRTSSKLSSIVPASTTKESQKCTIDTPTTSKESNAQHTSNNNDNDVQITPVNKIIKQFKQNHQIDTPATSQQSPSSPIPKGWYNIDTPETPLGAFLTPNPSPNLRKQIQRFINTLPDYDSPKPTRRDSTPLSELKRRLYRKLIADLPQQNTENNQESASGPSCSQVLDNDDNTKEVAVNLSKQFEELESLSMNNEFTRRKSRGFEATYAETNMNNHHEHKESQPLTVGWDFQDDHSNLTPVEQQQQQRIFILSGIENNLRPLLVKKLESLGGIVSDLQNYDPRCTHLLCPKPARNEKTLACMAAGKWILHTSYIDKCIEAGRFLNEEEFEFGNPLCVDNFKLNFDNEMQNRTQAMHWWRKEIIRRGYGAFKDMRAIVVATKREPIVRVIEAGGGVVIDIKPPFHDNIDATHCLLEPKNISDFTPYIPLAEQGIYCVNTLYISDFLHRTNRDIKDCILPHFIKYYNKK